jgi:hypothetical protein
MNNLIIIEQLPIIKAALEVKSAEIEAKTQDALSMICTEETVKTVKTLRADLNKEFAELEAQRKAVKDAVMKPYDEFEALYKDLISSKFKNADSELKGKISEVENGLKAEKEKEIKAYYDEYAASLHVSSFTYDRAGINVTLTASAKSLKEQCKAFCDKIHDDLLLIGTQQYPAEIAVEYEKSLNASDAIRRVLDRHLAIEEAERKAAEAKQIIAVEEQASEKVEAFLPPPEIIEAPVKEQMFTATFKVTASKPMLIALRDFLKNGGYKYEQ